MSDADDKSLFHDKSGHNDPAPERLKAACQCGFPSGIIMKKAGARMNVFTKANQNPSAGDGLRDLAADLLVGIHGNVQVEHRSYGKKTDVFFYEDHYGKLVKIYVEAKDYDKVLTREHVVKIWSDYSGIVKKNSPAILLIVTRNGLASGAQSFVMEEQDHLRHQTIWQLEDKSLGLSDYTQSLFADFYSTGLTDYYIPARASKIDYIDDTKRHSFDHDTDLIAEINQWILADGCKPMAVLGGYGAGKTCFANRLVSHLAEANLKDPTCRKPILVKLGSIVDYSNIDGLLGAQFTHECPARGFSFPRFMNLNAAGRFVIVLDGFDEMKHAMTWAVFRSQAIELNKFVAGNSKVLLLGRPSAFLTDQEHDFVLRGRRLGLDGTMIRIPGWPEFSEYELSPFGHGEISRFCRSYLHHIARLAAKDTDLPVDEAWIEERGREVSIIANNSPDLFGKPVHSKILVELSTRKEVNLDRLRDSSSKWDLYALFFEVVFDRELDKKSRQLISADRRQKFLQDLAHWLWAEREGSTNFVADEIPYRLVSDVRLEDDVEMLALLRELLAGPFLERKPGDTFYFVHRSFAEYLVSERMISNAPTEEVHGLYSKFYRDAVVEFLADTTIADGAEWVATLGSARETLSTPYLIFVGELVGSCAQAAKLLPASSPWGRVMAVLAQVRKDEATPVRLAKAVASELKSECRELELSLLLSLLQPGAHLHKGGSGFYNSSNASLIAAGLVASILRYTRIGAAGTYVYTSKEVMPVLKCCKACMAVIREAGRPVSFSFSWSNLMKHVAEVSAAQTARIELRESAEGMDQTKDITLKFSEILKHLQGEILEKFDEVLIQRGMTFKHLEANANHQRVDQYTPEVSVLAKYRVIAPSKEPATSRNSD